MNDFFESKLHKMNIMEHLEAIDIEQARGLGVDISAIYCHMANTDSVALLSNNLDSWIEKESVVLDKESRSEAKEYLNFPRNSTVSEIVTEYWETIFFSNFKIYKNYNDWGEISELHFIKLNSTDISKYQNHPNYNNCETLSMLKVAYSLMAKYDQLVFGIYGSIPGVADYNEKELNSFIENIIYQR